VQGRLRDAGAPTALSKQPLMRSEDLRAALRSHLEAVAAHMQAELAQGAEVPFELERHAGRGAGRAALYCYRPLTREFIATREVALAALPTCQRARLALTDFEGLERYLLAMGIDLAPAASALRVHAALSALIDDVFAEQSDFELREERVSAALARLEDSRGGEPSAVTLVAKLHGMAIVSHELAITGALRIVRAESVSGLPGGTPAPLAASLAPESADPQSEAQLLILLEDEDSDPQRALERGREALVELLRALRLFGDGRIALGALGWARVGAGAWHPCPIGQGGRAGGILLVGADQEDELRAFCNLVARRAPREDATAWALRRFELGCERASALEGLSDHLLALRALLEPGPVEEGALAHRLAALCAAADARTTLRERVAEAIELERAYRSDAQACAGASHEELAREVAGHLRALLRDVICGHLRGDLAALADELTDAEPSGMQEEIWGAEEEPLDPTEESARALLSAQGEATSPLGSLEEIFRDPRQAEEILDVLI
jgi:hypothetical protein